MFGFAGGCASFVLVIELSRGADASGRLSYVCVYVYVCVMCASHAVCAKAVDL